MIFKTAVCLLLAVNAGLVGTSLYRQSQEKPNDSFIYMTTAFPDEQLTEKLGQVGSRGWDMVFARRASDGNTYKPTFFYEMIFKRRCIPGQEVACLAAAADISKSKSLTMPLKTE
jgi:hypothetical protein